MYLYYIFLLPKRKILKCIAYCLFMVDLINNKYKIIEKIGEGSFGNIFKAFNKRKRENVVIKIESIIGGTKLLKHETIIYQYLKNTPGVPKIKWYGKDSVNYYMVLELLGPSLERVKVKSAGFSLRMTLTVGLKVLTLLRNIHEKGLIHRDVKPDNFLFGENEKTEIYIIDFGFCKSFIENECHIPFKKTHGLIGSLSFASINAHDCNELSRRDDIECLAYMLIYLFHGSLPWQTLSIPNPKERNQIIKEYKINILNNPDIHPLFKHYLERARRISFEETPNYDDFSSILENELKKIIR